MGRNSLNSGKSWFVPVMRDIAYCNWFELTVLLAPDNVVFGSAKKRRVREDKKWQLTRAAISPTSTQDCPTSRSSLLVPGTASNRCCNSGTCIILQSWSGILQVEFSVYTFRSGIPSSNLPSHGSAWPRYACIPSQLARSLGKEPAAQLYNPPSGLLHGQASKGSIYTWSDGEHESNRPWLCVSINNSATGPGDGS